MRRPRGGGGEHPHAPVRPRRRMSCGRRVLFAARSTHPCILGPERHTLPTGPEAGSSQHSTHRTLSPFLGTGAAISLQPSGFECPDVLAVASSLTWSDLHPSNLPLSTARAYRLREIFTSSYLFLFYLQVHIDASLATRCMHLCILGHRGSCLSSIDFPVGYGPI